MGLLSSAVSLTRYRVDGRIKAPIIETVADRLKLHTISEIDDVSEKLVGWTSFNAPFKPNFEGSSFVIGDYFVFSLRIDKKNLPSKIIKKYCAIEETKRLKESGRQYFSRKEKEMIQEHVINVLSLRIPSTPNIYDVIWSYEESILWFLSTLKAANEELEALFLKTFKIPVIRLFPYTMADLALGLSDGERDILHNLSATSFLDS